MSILIVSWTAYEPPDISNGNLGGTIGGLERDLHALASLLSQHERVVVLTGPRPNEQGPSTTKLGDYEIWRSPDLSPSKIKWNLPQIPVTTEGKASYFPPVRSALHELWPNTVIGFGLEGDPNLAAALFASRRSPTQKFVNVVATEWTDSQVLTMPWDFQIFETERLRDNARAIGAWGHAFVSPFGTDLLSMGRPHSGETVDPQLKDLGDHVIYLPALASDDAFQARLTIRAAAAMREQFGLESTIITPDIVRCAEPTLAGRRLRKIEREASRLEVRLAVLHPFELHAAYQWYWNADVVATWGNGHSRDEAITSLTPVVLTDRERGAPNPKRLAAELFHVMTTPIDPADLVRKRFGLLDIRDGTRRVAEVITRVQRGAIYADVTNLTVMPAELTRWAAHPGRNASTLGHDLNRHPEKVRYPSAKVNLVVVPITGSDTTANEGIKLAQDLGAECLLVCSTDEQMELVAGALRYRNLTGVTLISVEGFRNSDLLDSELFQHRLSASDIDTAQKHTLVTAIVNLVMRDKRRLRYQRVVFVDDDLSLDPQEIARGARYVGQKPGDLTVHIPVTDEPDNSITVHLARELGLDVGVFVGGGAKIAHARKLRLVPNIEYNEDYFAILDAIGERELAMLGDGTQLRGWATGNPTRAAQQTWGDILVMAALEWMTLQSEEGRLHRRSWLEMTPEFLEDYKFRWLLALEQLLQEHSNLPEQNRIAIETKQLNLDSIYFALDRARQFPVATGLDYLQKYARSSDKFDAVLREHTKYRSITDAAAAFGVKSVLAGQPIPKNYNRELSRYRPPPAFNSIRWLVQRPWPNPDAIDDTMRVVADSLNVDLNDLDLDAIGIVVQDITRDYIMRVETVGSRARLIDPAARVTPETVERWLSLPDSIRTALHRRDLTEYRRRAFDSISESIPDEFARQCLQRIVDLSLVRTLAQEAVTERLRGLHPIRKGGGPLAKSSQVASAIMQSERGQTSLNQLLGIAALAVNEIGQTFEAFWDQRQIPDYAYSQKGVRLDEVPVAIDLSLDPRLSQDRTESCILLSQLFFTPTGTEAGDRWQNEHTGDLAGAIFERWIEGGAGEINAQLANLELPDEIAALWKPLSAGTELHITTAPEILTAYQELAT